MGSFRASIPACSARPALASSRLVPVSHFVNNEMDMRIVELADPPPPQLVPAPLARPQMSRRARATEANSRQWTNKGPGNKGKERKGKRKFYRSLPNAYFWGKRHFIIQLIVTFVLRSVQ